MEFKIKDSKGITLLELLISLAIVSMISFMLFSIIDNTKRSNTKNDKDLKSMNIAQSEIENIIRDIKDGDDYMYINNKEIKLTTIRDIDSRDLEKYNYINQKQFQIDSEYEKTINGVDVYGINLYIGKIEKIQQKKKYFIYRVCVSVKSKSNFSTKDTVIQTEILQKF